jgi:hypothetical protein
MIGISAWSSSSRSHAPATHRCLPATRLRAARSAAYTRVSCQRSPSPQLHQRTTTSCRANVSAGTFTTKDPIGFGGRSANLYGYVRTDPVNRTDSDGTVDFALGNQLGAIATAGVLAGIHTIGVSASICAWTAAATAAGLDIDVPTLFTVCKVNLPPEDCPLTRVVAQEGPVTICEYQCEYETPFLRPGRNGSCLPSWPNPRRPTYH